MYECIFVCTYVSIHIFVSVRTNKRHHHQKNTHTHTHTHTHIMYVCMPSPLVNVPDSISRAGGEEGVTNSRGGEGGGGGGGEGLGRDLMEFEQLGGGVGGGGGGEGGCVGGGGNIHTSLQQDASLRALAPVTPEAPPPSRGSMSESDLLVLLAVHPAPPAPALPVLDTRIASAFSSYLVSMHVLRMCVRVFVRVFVCVSD